MPELSTENDHPLQTDHPPQTDHLSAQTEHLMIDVSAEDRLAEAALSAAARGLHENYPPSEITTRRARDCLRLIAASDLRGWIDELNVIRRRPDSGEASSTPPSSTLQAEYYRLIRILRKRLKDRLLQSDAQVWKSAWKHAIGSVDHAVFRVTESSVHLHRLMSNRQYWRHG
jgi:hypothetical protein